MSKREGWTVMPAGPAPDLAMVSACSCSHYSQVVETLKHGAIVSQAITWRHISHKEKMLLKYFSGITIWVNDREIWQIRRCQLCHHLLDSQEKGLLSVSEDFP